MADKISTQMADVAQEEHRDPYHIGYESGFIRYTNRQPLPKSCRKQPYLMGQYFTGMLHGYNDAKFDADSDEEAARMEA